MPPDVKPGALCKTATGPIGRSVPQPERKGPEGAPTVEVHPRAYITSTGAVVQPQVVRPVRPDLDAEALGLVAAWQFDPATCNGGPNTVPADLTVQFQGW